MLKTRNMNLWSLYVKNLGFFPDYNALPNTVDIA